MVSSNPGNSGNDSNARQGKAIFGRAIAHLQSRNLEEANRCLKQLLRLRHADANLYYNCGVLAEDLNRFPDAEHFYQKALAVNPRDIAALDNLGSVLHAAGKPEQALALFERAIGLAPGEAQLFYNRGSVLLSLTRFEDALASFDRAIALKPGYAKAWINRSVTLGELRRYEDAVASIDRALALDPGQARAHSIKIFLFDNLPQYGFAEHQAERRRFYELHAKDLLREMPAPRIRTGVPVPLRLGYVSADFRQHSASLAFGAVLRRHDRSRFELVLYSGVPGGDSITGEYRRLAHRWVPTAGMSDEALAQRIRADGIDVLIDLSGHSSGNRLLVFARKPAPVQVTAWGHATGTGLRTIDYFFADPVAVPAAVRGLFAEEIYDLPCVCPYEAPARLPDLAVLPALRSGRITFGCLNRFKKVSSDAIRLWSQILQAVPGSRLLLKDGSLDDPQLSERALQAFAGHGIGSERIEVRGGTDHYGHLSAYNEVDIALDPFPYGGGVTTWEAITMGVPTVSKLGDSIPGRLCGAIMSALGFGDWVAQDESGYARIAVEQASDLERLARFRRESRARIGASPAGNPDLYTRAVEAAYVEMWERKVLGAGRVER